MERAHKPGAHLRRRRLAAAIAVWCVVAAMASPAVAVAAPLLVSRASGPSGTPGNGDSGRPAVSANGRFVAFESSATNLVPVDSDRIPDVYVRDLATDQTVLVSRASGADGAKGNADSGQPELSSELFGGPSISPDGRYVAFASNSTNLDPEVPGQGRHVYVRDLVANTTEVVDRAMGPDGTVANGVSFDPSISAGGRRVSFTSRATNLDPADPDPGDDVYVRDLATGATSLVSRAAGEAGPRGADTSNASVIAADGSAVAFVSFAKNLVPNASIDLDVPEVFLRDLETHATVLASRASGAAGAPASGNSMMPSVSASGGRVAFATLAGNLHPSDRDKGGGVFVRALASERTIFASRGLRPWGGERAEFPRFPSISADGDLVAFEVQFFENARARVEVRNLGKSRTRPVADAIAGFRALDPLIPALSADGRHVAFQSRSTKIVADDRRRDMDVFRVRRK